MRITLVHPAGSNFELGKRDVSILVNRMAPLGILQLASWLEQKGHSTSVCDCLGPVARGGIHANVHWVLQTKPDLVGFSTTTSGFLEACEMARLIKEMAPELKIVVGGAHPSALGAGLLAYFPEFDYLCVGEGEGVIADLADGKAVREIGNLVYRENGRVMTNPRRPRIKNLDDLPFPAYEKLSGFPKAYHLPLFSFVKRYGATMITSRGCVYNCSYCDRTVFEHRYASNSPGYVWEHLRHLRDTFGVFHVNFYDDLFTANRQRLAELCERLARRPLGVDFNCAIRVGHTDRELLALLRRAGCLQVSLGIESGDPELLARHKAGITIDGVRDTVKRVHAAGLRAKGLFIFGLPGETPMTVRTTSQFIDSLDLDELNISKFSPFYGAPIWAECRSGASGSLHEDWRLMNCLHFTFLPDGFESRRQMDFLYAEAIQRFYQGRHYQKLLRSRLWQHRWSIWYVLRHLPGFIAAQWRFSPHKSDMTAPDAWPSRHPAQPLSIEPHQQMSTPTAVREVQPG